MATQVSIKLNVATSDAVSNVKQLQENFSRMFGFIKTQGGIATSKFLQSLNQVGIVSKTQIEKLRRDAGRNPVNLRITVNEADIVRIKKVAVDTLAEVQAKTRGFNFNTLLDGASGFKRLTEAQDRFRASSIQLANGGYSKGVDAFKASLANLRNELKDVNKTAAAAKKDFIGFVSTLSGKNIETYSAALSEARTVTTGLSMDLGRAEQSLIDAKTALALFIAGTDDLSQDEFDRLSQEVKEAATNVGLLQSYIDALSDAPASIASIGNAFTPLNNALKQIQGNLNLKDKIDVQTESFRKFYDAAGQQISLKSLQDQISTFSQLSRELTTAKAATDQFATGLSGIGDEAAIQSIQATSSALTQLRVELGGAIKSAFEGYGGKALGNSMQELFSKASLSGKIEDKGVQDLFNSLTRAFDGAKTAAGGMQEFSTAATGAVAASLGSSEAVGALSQNAHYLSVEALKAATGLESIRQHILDLAGSSNLSDTALANLTASIDQFILASKKGAGELRILTKGLEQLELSEAGVAVLNEELHKMSSELGRAGSQFSPSELGAKFKKISKDVFELIDGNEILKRSLETLDDNPVSIQIQSNIDDTTRRMTEGLANIGKNLSAELTKSIDQSLRSLRIDPSVSKQLGASFSQDFNRAASQGAPQVSGALAFQAQFASQFQDAARATAALDDINVRLAKTGGIAKLSENEVRAFSSEVSAASNTTARVSDGLVKMKSQLLDNAGQFGLTAQQGRLYADALNKIQVSMGAAQAPLSASKRQLETQGKLLEQARLGLDQYATQLVSATVQNSIFVASFGAIIGAVALFKDAIKSVVELQLQSSRVVAVTRDVTRTNSELADVISSELTRATVQYGVSIDQTAQILREFGSAGLDAQESMAALDSTLQAVIATEGEAAEFTRTIAGIFSIMGDEIDSTTGRLGALTTINDTMVRAFKESQLELTELVQGFRFSSASARNVGVDFQELTALLELLNNNLIKSGQAGRSLQTTFSQIAQKTRQFEEAFNIDIDTSNGIDFIEIVRQISEKLGEGALTATEIEKVFGLLGLEGARSFLVVTQQVEEFDRLLLDLKENAEGSAEATANIRLDTIRGQLDILRETALEFFRALVTPTLGSNFKPLQAIIENLSGALKLLTSFLNTGVGQAVAFLVTSFSALTGVLVVSKVVALAFGEASKLITIALSGEAVATTAARNAIVQKASASAFEATANGVRAGTIALVTGATEAETIAVLGAAAAEEAATAATLTLSAANVGLLASYGPIALILVGIGVAIAAAARLSKDATDRFKETTSAIRSQQIEINENISAYRGLSEAIDEVVARQRYSADSQEGFGQSIRDAIDRYGASLDLANSALNQNNESLARNIDLLQRRAEIEQISAEVERNRLQDQFEQEQQILRTRIAQERITRGDANEGRSFGDRVSRFAGVIRTQIFGPNEVRDLERSLDELQNYADNAGREFAETLAGSGIADEVSRITDSMLASGASVEEITSRQSDYFATLGFNLQEVIELSEQLATTQGRREFALDLNRARTSGNREEFSTLARNFALVQSNILQLIQTTNESFDTIEYRIAEFGQRIARLQGNRTFLDTGFFDAQAAGLGFDTLTESAVANFQFAVQDSTAYVLDLTGNVEKYRDQLRAIAADRQLASLQFPDGGSALEDVRDRLSQFYDHNFSAMIDDTQGALSNLVGNAFSGITFNEDIFAASTTQLHEAFSTLIHATGSEYDSARDEFERILTGAIVPIGNLTDLESELFRERAASIVQYVLAGLEEAESLRNDAIDQTVRGFNREALPAIANVTFSNLADIGVDQTAIDGLFNNILAENPQNIDTSRLASYIAESLGGEAIDAAIEITPIIESATSIEEVQRIINERLFGGQLDSAQEMLAIAEAQVRLGGQQFSNEAEFTNAVLQRVEAMGLTLVAQKAVSDQLQLQIDAAYAVARVSINQLTNLREQNRQIALQVELIDGILSVEARRAEIEVLRNKIARMAGASTESELETRRALEDQFNRLLEQEAQRNSLIAQRRRNNLQDRNISRQAANEAVEALVSAQQRLAEFGGESLDLFRQLSGLEDERLRQLELLGAAQANNTDYIIADLEYLESTIDLIDEITQRNVELARSRVEETDILAEILFSDSERVEAAIRLRSAQADIIDAQTQIDALSRLGIDTTDRTTELNNELLQAQRELVRAGSDLNRLDAERLSTLEQYVELTSSLEDVASSARDRSEELLRGALQIELDERPFRNAIGLARDFGISLRHGIPEDLIDTIVERIEDMPDAFHGANREMRDLVDTFTEYTALQEDLAQRQTELVIAQIAASRQVAESLLNAGDYSGALDQLSEQVQLAATLGETAPRTSIGLIDQLRGDIERVGEQADQARMLEDNVIVALTDNISRGADVTQQFVDSLNSVGIGLSGFEVEVTSARDVLGQFLKTYDDGLAIVSAIESWSDWGSAIADVVSQLRILTQEYTNLSDIQIQVGAGFDLQDTRVGQGRGQHRRSGGPIYGFSNGGRVGGKGAGDIVPAMLEPGEFVVPRRVAAAIGPEALEALRRGDYRLLSVLMRGRVPGFKNGGMIGASSGSRSTVGTSFGEITSAIGSFVDSLYDSTESIAGSNQNLVDIIAKLLSAGENSGLAAFDAQGTQASVLNESDSMQSAMERFMQQREAVVGLMNSSVSALETMLEDFTESFATRIRSAMQLGIIDNIRNSFASMFDEVRRGVGSVMSFLNIAFDQGQATADAAAEATSEAAESSREDLLTALRRNEISYYEYLNRLEDLLASSYDDQLKAQEDALTAAVERWKTYVDAVAQVFSGVGDRLAQSALEGINSGFDRLFQTIGDGLNEATIGFGIGIGKGLRDAGTNAMSALASFASEGGRGRRQGRRTSRDKTGDPSAFSEAISGALENIGEFFTGIGSSLKGLFTTEGLVGAAQGLGEFAKNAAAISWKAASFAGVSIAKGAIALGGILTKFSAGAQDVTEGFIANIVDLPAAIDSVVGRISENLPRIVDSIVESAPAIAQSLVDGIPKVVSALVEGVPKVAGALIDAAMEIVPAIIEQLPMIVQGLIETLVTLLPMIGTLLGEILSSFAGIVDDLLIGIIDSIPAIIDGFVDFISNFIDTLPQTVINLVQGILEAIPKLIVSIFTKLLPKLIVGIGKLLFNFLIKLPAKLIEGIGKAIGRFFGGIFGGKKKNKKHRGGVVGPNISDVETYQQAFGTKKDEVNALLLKGEGVLSRNGMQALGGSKILDALNGGVALSEIIAKANSGLSGLAVRSGTFTPPPTFSSQPSVDHSMKGSSNVGFNAPITMNLVINGNIDQAAATEVGQTISDEIIAKLVDAIKNKKNPELTSALKGFIERTT